MAIFEDPRDYSTPETQLRFVIFLIMFIFIALPYIFYKLTKLMMSGSAKLFGSLNEAQRVRKKQQKEDETVKNCII